MKKLIFLILIISLFIVTPVFGIYLNFDEVDFAPYGTEMFKLYDTNGDGIDEIVFRGTNSIENGTEKFLIYSFTEDSLLLESEPVGGEIRELCASDINDDGYTDIIYSFDNDTHYVKLTYGPDFSEHRIIYSRTQGYTITEIIQVGTFRENLNPIYLTHARDLFVIGDNLEVVDSIPHVADDETIGGFTVDWLGNGDYRLTKFRCITEFHIHDYEIEHWGYIDIYNELFELVISQRIYYLDMDHPYFARVDFFETVYDHNNHPSSYILAWNHGHPHWEFNLELIPFGGGEVNRIQQCFAEYGMYYRFFLNAYSVDYSGDSNKSLLTLQQIVNPLGFILRDTETGEEIGYGNTEHIGGNGIFGNCDPEPGKELYVNHTRAIRVYKIWESQTDVGEDDTLIPDKFELVTNYPNPFNSSTTIKYLISENSNARLDTYNLAGQHLETLINNRHQPGEYEVIWDAWDYSSGIYFFKLTSGEDTFTRKMVLLK
ncbi:MAG: T9SS type A sorting domain-containing protein [candidate division Zixibacteria bacterium]|nr:T9SS type A sorting domain-containing protein [candidate division Zixibacteria bacterium]